MTGERIVTTRPATPPRDARIDKAAPQHVTPARGFALIVALIALAAMSAAAAMLVRAVDTATAVTASLVLRIATIAATDAALEQAIAALADGGAIADRDRDDPGQGYYATRQAGEDARAIPRPLQQSPPAGAARITATDGTTLAYVIERLCLAPGPAAETHCALYRPRPPSTAPPSTLYRISVRADGAQQANALVQATVHGTAPPTRVSWRIVSD